MALEEVQQLVQALRGELGRVDEAIREHRYLDALESGEVAIDDLKLFAAAQTAIIASDRASFLRLAALFPWEAAGAFFLEMADGEAAAASHLGSLCAALELGGAELAGIEVPAGCYAYPSFVAWLASAGERAAAAIAFVVNLESRSASFGRMATVLRDRFGFDDTAAGFFDFFAQPEPAFEQAALVVATEGFAQGESVIAARRAARLLQAYELLYWDTLAAAL